MPASVLSSKSTPPMKTKFSLFGSTAQIRSYQACPRVNSMVVPLSFIVGTGSEVQLLPPSVVVKMPIQDAVVPELSNKA